MNLAVSQPADDRVEKIEKKLKTPMKSQRMTVNPSKEILIGIEGDSNKEEKKEKITP